MTRPIGVDLFAGAGGLSLGFEQAGFDVKAAVELDPVHAAVHKYNFPNTEIIPASITDITGEMIRAESGIRDRQVDVVFGGAPCQGFSLIGQRALDDPRNALVQEFARLVRELDATYFVFENVKGLTVGRHRAFLDELIELFVSMGYEVRTPWRVLNACEYGVPQDRERLFLIGAKKGANLPEYPEPTTGHPEDLIGAALPTCPTCRDALDDLPDLEKFPELWDSDEIATLDWGRPSKYARMLRCIGDSGWFYGYRRSWDKRLLTSSMRTDHTAISRRRFASTKPGDVEPVSRFFRLSASGIANTLRAGTDASRGAFTSPRPIHYDKPRCISVREMARLHGFPDWFRFQVTKWHGARQVGNAVPPPLARAVASVVVKALGKRPSAPKAILELGDPLLLSLDVSQACVYWKVENAIGRRDKKNGVRKRSQVDVEMSRILAGRA